MSQAKWVQFARSNLFPTAALVFVIAVSMCLAQWLSRDRPEPISLLDLPPVVTPPVVSPDKAKLPDDCQVIGVTHNGKYRAYVVSAFSRPHQHVINDLVGGKPFTITYCYRTNCVQVFTSSDSREPLKISVGGWLGTEVFGTLLLQVDSKLFRQDTLKAISGGEDIPYSTVDFERTTWKDWHTKHPDSDVYLKYPSNRMRGVPNG